MIHAVSAKVQRVLFGSLATLACLAALKSLVWPRWPAVGPLDQQIVSKSLRAAKFDAVPLATLPARRSYEQATSPVLVFGIGQGQTLRLLRGISRQRINFQAALLASSNQVLKLQNRQLLNSSPPSALGQVGGAPVRQTCLVIGEESLGGYGVIGEQLLTLVDQVSAGRRLQLEARLGLRSTRSYECVLISVSSQKDSDPIQESRWNRLLEAIRPALGKGAATGGT
jgi:hypothetical protein